MQDVLVAVEEPHELGDAVLEEEALVLLRPLVDEVDGDAGVEEGQFAQAVGEDLVFELARDPEDLGVGLEGDLRAGLLGLADHRHLLRGFALRAAHVVDLAVAAHLGLEPFGDGVHAFRADAVQAARHLVGALAELAAGVKIGEHEFERRNLVHRVHVDGNAAPVVLDRARAVEVDAHRDVRGKAGQGLVDGVVDDLEDAVVKTALHRVADVHVGAFADTLEALELLDFGGVVFGGASLDFTQVFRVFLVGHAGGN